ncbi:hypothetical protein ASG25_14155 [Rhizobium sp. Leaf384]|uniref:hypothetical protein n=1 Tax=unclassified Rhizobium TaxID=2613769 RepID=UPI0007127C3E|nr:MULTISPECIES: hypothetical protein [unclassified Rhizobium]KQR75802.1 hypothetical protein ASG03_19235 [Rhizobium sp. Leaf341]KQS76454.1 hypothetical protein ASG58_11585 [Rhizobium sp. Leaf383]KQS77723.1 hypothetical protein ASG25_14155 [Rhizobium sp. Leaf384]
MTDIGNPIPRGTIDTDADPDAVTQTDAPLVDEALAAKENPSSNDAADTVAALKAEIETLRSRIADRGSDATARLRATIRSTAGDRPMTSLAAALLTGYALALAIHGRSRPDHSWYRRR